MKKYDHKTKKWVTEEEFERLKNFRAEKSKFCKGKKPHDYILVLPWGATYNENYKFTPEVYYEAMEKRAEFVQQQAKELLQFGIIDRHWSGKTYKVYECSVCGKRDSTI